MDNSEHSSTHNIKNLATSLIEKIETLYPLTQDCCIYRVPQFQRRLNPSAYIPQTVSIGPLYHGKEELKAMEEHKLRYLKHFLDRTTVSIEVFLSFIKDNEVKLRNCYAETIELKSDDFVRVILVDAIFLIEFLLRDYESDFITEDDRLFGKSVMAGYMFSDLFLVENQIPLFILNDCFNLVKTDTHEKRYERLSLSKITFPFLKSILEFSPVGEICLSEMDFLEAKHFLDLVRLCLQPSQSPPQNIFHPLPTATELQDAGIPTAKELHEAGVKFQVRPSNDLFCITFNKGILEIPRLKIYLGTSCLFQNLLAFEELHGDSIHCVNDYVALMSSLVNTTRDVELLVQNGIIENWLSHTQKVSNVFRDLVTGTTIHFDFRYSDLVKDLKAHCRNPCHKWKAILKQNYFNTPWASISVIAAVTLIVLTFIQTVCSIKGL